jgi:pyruvate dehydrogenase phosphatase
MIKTVPPSAPPSSLAYHTEIPGSRCDPEDGPWPRPFQLLSESEVATELNYHAKPHSFPVGNHFMAYGVNFQPCNNYRTQDRYAVKELDVHGTKWTFTGVFDGMNPCCQPYRRLLIITYLGHLGDTTVEHTAHHLPIIIQEFLVASDPSVLRDPGNVSRILSHSMTSFDKAIAGDVLEIFPGGLESLSTMSDYNIQSIILNNIDSQISKKARLCMYGTTALVALVDPQHENLWVANLGDCQGG